MSPGRRFAGAALIPIDDGEALLERRIEVAEETHLGKAWPAVQEDQRRMVRLSPRIITH
jgi:hypothetical protein